MQSNFKATKSEIRTDFLKQLNHISHQQKSEWSSSIQKNLSKLISNEQGFWGAYQNLSNEPVVDWSTLSEKVQWCFPVVIKNNLEFRQQVLTFQRSALGVNEPLDGQTIPSNELQGVVVPGLGFSRKGHRLGRGKGYYDRYLSTFQGKKIAVCFDLTLVSDLPNESHDILFQKIVTESSIYQVDHAEGDLKWN